MDRTGSGGNATCCFCYCQFFERDCVAGGPDQMLVGQTPSLNRFVGLTRQPVPGRAGRKRTRPISFGVPELEHFFVPFFLSFFLSVCGFRDCLFVDCVSGKDPTEREGRRKQKMKSKLSTDFRWRRRLSTRRHRALLPSLIHPPLQLLGNGLKGEVWVVDHLFVFLKGGGLSFFDFLFGIGTSSLE